MEIKIIIGLFSLILLSGCCSFKELHYVYDKDCPETWQYQPEPNFEELNELLDKAGLQLGCYEFEQIEVLRYNLTCPNVCLEGDCEPVIIISEVNKCWHNIEPIKSEPISTYVNGSCLHYSIIKKQPK